MAVPSPPAASCIFLDLLSGLVSPFDRSLPTRSTGVCLDADLKEIPHNARGTLTAEFQPSAACKTLDYQPGNLRFLQFASD